MIDFDKHHDATDTVAEIEDELKSDIQRSSKDIKDDKIEFPENQSPAEEIVSVPMAFPIMTKDLVKYRNKSETFLEEKLDVVWESEIERAHCAGAICFRINSGYLIISLQCDNFYLETVD